MNKINLRCIFVASVAGFIVSFLILHSFFMLFQVMKYPVFIFTPAVLVDAFTPHHIPMAFIFGLLGLVLGWSLICFQVDFSKEKKRVKLLEGFLTICCYCKKIRDLEDKEQ